SVIRAVETSVRVVRLNQGINTVGIRAYCNANFSVGTLRQTVFFDPLPTGSAIIGTIKSAAWSAVGQVPRTATLLPQRRELDICVVRIKGHIDTPTVFVLVQNLIPGFAAVSGAEKCRARCWDHRDGRVRPRKQY